MATVQLSLGMSAPKCNCKTHCEKGVDPMETCICKIPGEVITAYCDQCDPKRERFTWHVNGSCMNCVNRVREDRKKQLAERHARIMASPANPDRSIEEIEDADYTDVPRPSSATALVTPSGQPLVKEEPVRYPVASPPSGSFPSGLALLINGQYVTLTNDPVKIAKVLQDLIR